MTRSDKHTPRLDDELKREVEGHLQGSPAGSRAEEWREPESPADGEPEVTVAPQSDPVAWSDVPLHLTPNEIEERSRLGRYLPRSAFPADRGRLLPAARRAEAPDGLIEQPT